MRQAHKQMGIDAMVEIKTFQDKIEWNVPLRMMRYTLITCSLGRVNITIDNNRFTLHANEVITITTILEQEIFVLEGVTVIEGRRLRKGDSLYTPPGFKHSVSTPLGCILLLILKEVEIL